MRGEERLCREREGAKREGTEEVEKGENGLKKRDIQGENTLE